MAEELKGKEVFGDDFLALVLTCVVANSPELMAQLAASPPRDAYQMELRINGVETPLRPFLQKLEEQFEHIVNEAASKRLQDLFQGRFNAISDTLYEAERGLRDELRKVGLIREGD